MCVDVCMREVRLPFARQLQTAELVQSEAGQLAPQQAEVEIVGVGEIGRRRGWGLRGGRMLWPQLHAALRRARIAVRQRLHEVRVQRAAVRARHHVAVVAEVVQPLRRMQHWFVARITLYAFSATRHGSEDIVGVHGTQH